jgi:hypothetical protein
MGNKNSVPKQRLTREQMHHLPFHWIGIISTSRYNLKVFLFLRVHSICVCVCVCVCVRERERERERERDFV